MMMDGQVEDVDFYTLTNLSVPPVPVFVLPDFGTGEVPSAIEDGMAHTLTDLCVASVPVFHEDLPSATNDGMDFNADVLQELDSTLHGLEPTDAKEEPKDCVDAMPPPPPKSAKPKKKKAPKVKKPKYYELDPDNVSDPNEKSVIIHAKKSRAYRQKINDTIAKAKEIRERKQTTQDLLLLSFLEQMYGFSAKEIYDKNQKLHLWITPVSNDTVTVEMIAASNEDEVAPTDVINE